MKKQLLFILLFMTGIVFNSNAQFGIDGVSYKLKYNTDSCWYDFYLVINSGSAITEAERHQLNAQISIVTPTGSTLSIPRGYMPLINNSVPGTGEYLPNFWSINSHIVNPISAPGKDFWGIYPNFTASNALYNDLFQGNEVKLFSLISSSLKNCGKDVRLYVNGIDPTSADPGMGGSDFTNAFYIQSQSNPVYDNNAPQTYPPIPFIDPDPLIGCGNGIEIDLTATTSGCLFPLTYAWTGPNGYTSTTEDVAIFPASAINEGTYKVVVTDSLGCIDSLLVDAYSKPQAGPDQVVCAGTSASVSGTSPTTGIWSGLSTNPPGATINPNVDGKATIAFSNAALGVFKFKYATPLCSDTITITVNAKPTAILGAQAICANLTTTLSSNQTGTWVSNNTTVATTTASGFVTGISQGIVTFKFTNTTTGCQNTTPALVVNPGPTVTINTDSICIGSTASLTPTSGGTWTSTATSVATVTNLGLATGVASGVAKLVFRQTLSPNCVSDTIVLSVLARPTVTLTGPNPICIGGTTTFLPSSGGTWNSDDATIITITNSGLVTGVLPGSASVIFTQNGTGCTANSTTAITVQAKPTISGVPATPRCIGTLISLSPSSGGTWVSNNTSVATINATTGVVTAVGPGTVNFTFTTIAGCSNTSSNLVVSPKPTVSSAMNAICVGSSTTIAPNPAQGTGTWTNLTPTKIVRSGGNVIGIAAGEGQFIFTETATSCVSDTLKITVKPRPIITLIGNDSICVGTTTSLTPSTGGSWSTANGSIATVTNSGKVTGVTPGFTTLTYTNNTTSCVSEPLPITILPNPAVNITGPDKICIGNTTTLSPATGGVWASSNSSVATITNGGLVTGISLGNAVFVFTEALFGCVSYASSPVTVGTKVTPIIADNTLCIDQTTTVSPSAGGTWVSSNTSVATITNAGLVTGISVGSVSFTYTANDPNCLSDPIAAKVSAKPTVTFTGLDTLCVGSTTTLSASQSGGTWASTDTSIAIVTSSGSVTAVASGTAAFIYTNIDGCSSDATTVLYVLPKPVLTHPTPFRLCIGNTLTLNANTSGTWTSSAPGIATVNATTGLVTAFSTGTASFSFMSTNGCPNTIPTILTVNAKPVITPPIITNICIGKTASFAPNTGGSWVSSSPTIATINNSGLATGVNPGTATFTFTQTSTGCPSDPSGPLTVNSVPTIGLLVADQICIGGTTTITPSTGGKWSSSDPTVATITNGGLVTGIGSGLATFRFTDTLGCKSQPSSKLIVEPNPKIAVNGPSTIKVNETTTLTSNAAGTWLSLNPAIATVNSSGIVIGITEGIAGIQFVSNTGCLSDTTFIEVKGYNYFISGFCFTDINGNNIFDDNVDFPLPNVNINISNDSITYYTNVNGYFNIPVDSGAVVMNNTIHFGNWVNDTIVRNLTIVNPRSYVFVGFVPSSSGNNATGLAAASSSKAQCKSFANLYAQAFNASSQLADGYLIVAYDARTYINASSPLPSGGQDNYLVWTFSDLPPGRTFSPDIEYWVPDAVSADDSLHFTVYMVELATGDTLSTFALAQAIECNDNINLDKARTWPDRAGDDNYTLVGEQISYNITFSNKGNGPASNAAIACVIDKNLDLASLKIQKSSHNFDVSSMNGILTFYADSIELEASTREGNSEVYVSFTLDQNPGLADKTKLYLDAELSLNNGYKDKSNTVINTIVGILPCDLINDGITKIGNNLYVTSAGTSHTWYDCITGAQVGNGSTFKPSDNGKFYCVIEGLACKQQTECFDFIYTNTDESDDASINVYPNPVHDALYIDCAATMVYTVVKDMMGKEILHTYDRQIPLRNFTSGMYLLKIKFGEHEVVKRIVKL